MIIKSFELQNLYYRYEVWDVKTSLPSPRAIQYELKVS